MKTSTILLILLVFAVVAGGFLYYQKSKTTTSLTGVSTAPPAQVQAPITDTNPVAAYDPNTTDAQAANDVLNFLNS
jgi:hypothetical protein